MLYKIVRDFRSGKRYTVRGMKGLTLREAQEHCSDPQTSSKTCTTEQGRKLTAKYGPWFDSFDEDR